MDNFRGKKKMEKRKELGKKRDRKKVEIGSILYAGEGLSFRPFQKKKKMQKKTQFTRR
jgi:hypothetical protein